MIKRLLAILILATIVGTMFAGKIILNKGWQHTPSKRHPYTAQLKQPRWDNIKSKPANYDKLLVILVDFQLESPDDPLTTGNGKFQLEPDPAYLYSIGSPPHDRQYYQANLDAMRYYYLAVSNETYNLQYDVFPIDRPAYTLPNSMSYYNPPGASSELFVSRMEEYFRDCFEIADQTSPEIDFSAYGHYMIIHAGSDWQHDVFGDTPSDIPSFFIRVGEGKEASVDNGAVLISHACNVPATISQDFTIREDSGNTIRGGYGAINAVLAHEFGHSLGLVDLYNVYNFQPMVGVFDIMDSGGGGVLVDVLDDGSYVMVEGVLPALPGAFSRVLLFEDAYKQQGLLKDVAEISLDTPFQLSATSRKQSGSIRPHTIRIPLSPDEYLLVENRSVDPDNDGATAVFSTLDGRVILYPTPLNDPNSNPSYEYDYLLPSFQRSDGSAVGGGLLVWHVNNSVIYDQGVTLSDGSWVSNFENNTVNTRYSNRGVKIIEADDLPDIGYDWSWYWTGTQYEYFHKNKPVLDTNGYFVNWSQNLWKPELSSTTKPKLLDTMGLGSQYWLSEIGNPGHLMTLTLRSGFFAKTQMLDLPNAATQAAPVIRTSFGDLEMPILDFDTLNLLSYTSPLWTDQMGDFSYSGEPWDYPITKANQSTNNFDELVLSRDNRLHILEIHDDELAQMNINLPDMIVCAPLAHENFLYVASESGILKIRENTPVDFIAIDGTRNIAIHDGKLLVVGASKATLISVNNMSIVAAITLPETFGKYEPVSFSESGAESVAFMMADSGNIYAYDDSGICNIFTNTLTTLPTQMGLMAYPAESPVLFFGNGSRVYALTSNGTHVNGFPYNANPLEFEAHAHPYAILMESPLMYLPVKNRGYVAISHNPGVVWDKSLMLPDGVKSPQLHWSNISSKLTWYYTGQDRKLNIHSVDAPSNPIVWNGFRNAGYGELSGAIYHQPGSGASLQAFLYPSPVRGSDFRVRLENSSADTQVTIFDITGAKMYSMVYPFDQQNNRDIQIQKKLASGVYILTVTEGKVTRRVKFAVEQ